MDRDLSRSRAILISNAFYSDPGIHDLPAASGCTPAMKGLLTSDLCGWPGGRVESLQDVPSPSELARKLVGSVKGVEDVLLLYYVGHGMRTAAGQLVLALGDTSADHELLPHTAITYEAIAGILRHCPAVTKLVILDCCHAELGNKANYQFQSADIDAEPVDGLYFIGASRLWERARSPLTGGLPYFTDAFIEVVRTGIPGKTPQLTIDQIFTELRARLLRANLPEPVQSGIRDARHWSFASNAAPPETHLDLDREVASLLEWKAAAEVIVQRLQAEVAEGAAEVEALQAQLVERAAEVERLREQVQGVGSQSVDQQQLSAELREARAQLEDATRAQAAAQAKSRQAADKLTQIEKYPDEEIRLQKIGKFWNQRNRWDRPDGLFIVTSHRLVFLSKVKTITTKTDFLSFPLEAVDNVSQKRIMYVSPAVKFHASGESYTFTFFANAASVVEAINQALRQFNGDKRSSIVNNR